MIEVWFLNIVLVLGPEMVKFNIIYVRNNKFVYTNMVTDSFR